MRLAAVGSNCIDYYNNIDGGKAFPGGGPVNMAVYTLRLGGEAAYIGPVGDDVYGQIMIETIKAKGVDTSHLRVEKGKTAVTQVELIDGERVFGDYDEGVLEKYKFTDEDIDYINVHGTGTPGNDASEGMALRRIFGEHVPPFSSVKAFIGHTLGASEGIEAVYSVLSIDKGMIYPNLNFTEPMPETELLSETGVKSETGLIPETSFQEGLPIRHVLSNSFGFGGNDSSLLFSATNFPKRTNL